MILHELAIQELGRKHAPPPPCCRRWKTASPAGRDTSGRAARSAFGLKTPAALRLSAEVTSPTHSGVGRHKASRIVGAIGLLLAPRIDGGAPAPG